MEDLSWCTQGMRDGVVRWGKGAGGGGGGGGVENGERRPSTRQPTSRGGGGGGGGKKWSVLRRKTVKPYVDHPHVLFVAFGGHSLSGNPLSGYFSERQSGR